MIERSYKRDFCHFLYVLPALFLYFTFNFVPFLGTYVVGLYRWTGVRLSAMQFVGLTNYIQLWSDEVVHRSLFNNLLFLCNEAIIATFLGLAIALLLCGIRHAKVFRSIFFLPVVLPLVMVGIMFALFLNPIFGPINLMLRAIGLSGLARPWLAEKNTALLSLMAARIWWHTGFYMILFVAGLDTIPKTLYDAARVDGANKRQVFFYVTLPLLKTTIAVVEVLAIMDGFKIFVIPFIMTGGGPAHATQVLSTWAYYTAFWLDKMGYGSAVASILVTISFIFSLIFLRSVRFYKTK